MLAARGAVVVDADVVARRVVEPGSEAWSKLVEHFGEIILHDDRTIHREVLAQIVFGEPARVALLNEITHPPIMREIADQLEMLRGTDEIVVLDAPLLIEAGGASMCDFLVVVVAREETQVARLRRDRGMDPSDARARMRAQVPVESKAASADWLVTNDGPLEALEGQVVELWKVLDERRGSAHPG